MIHQIKKLAQNCANLNILVLVKESGDLSMTFIPTVKKGGDEALAKPFTLSGTPAEMESGLVDALEKIAETRETLAEQVAATIAVIEMATKASADKGTKALKGKETKPVISPHAGSPADGSEDTDDDEVNSPGSSYPAEAGDTSPVIQSSPQSQATASPAMNLFS